MIIIVKGVNDDDDDDDNNDNDDNDDMNNKANVCKRPKIQLFFTRTLIIKQHERRCSFVVS